MKILVIVQLDVVDIILQIKLSNYNLNYFMNQLEIIEETLKMIIV